MKKAAKFQKQEQGTAVYGATEFADMSGKFISTVQASPIIATSCVDRYDVTL